MDPRDGEEARRDDPAAHGEALPLPGVRHRDPVRDVGLLGGVTVHAAALGAVRSDQMLATALGIGTLTALVAGWAAWSVTVKHWKGERLLVLFGIGLAYVMMVYSLTGRVDAAGPLTKLFTAAALTAIVLSADVRLLGWCLAKPPEAVVSIGGMASSSLLTVLVLMLPVLLANVAGIPAQAGRIWVVPILSPEDWGPWLRGAWLGALVAVGIALGVDRGQRRGMLAAAVLLVGIAGVWSFAMPMETAGVATEGLATISPGGREELIALAWGALSVAVGCGAFARRAGYAWCRFGVPVK